MKNDALVKDLKALKKELCARYDKYEHQSNNFKLGGLSPSHSIDRAIELIIIRAKGHEAMTCAMKLMELMEKHGINGVDPVG